MASVFLSYDREDADKARPIAIALEKAGHSVWWDVHVRGGAQFSKVIEEALKAADAVVVLWSARSVDSAWVRDEAAAGRDSGRLIPVHLDGTDPPLGFRQFQGIDLSNWRGRVRSAPFDQLLDAIENSGTEPAATPPPIASSERGVPWFRTRLLPIALLAATIIAAAFVVWRQTSGKSHVPVVAVAAVDQSAAAKDLARDLFARLGTLQMAKADSMRLITADKGSSRADLRFEVAGTNNPGESAANLVLLSGKDDSLLWSQDFKQPSGRLADLNQQIALTAARVLDCALEGMAPDALLRNRQTLKLYLNVCAEMGEIEAGDPQRIVAPLLQVTEEAPRFRAAWAKLILAEVESIASHGYDSAPPAEDISVLRAHLAEARKIDPEMPEATLAEISLLPPLAIKEQIELIDRAKRRAPDNPTVLDARSQLMMTVGRVRDAILDARRAKELDPLSPSMHQGFVMALAYGGRLDAARRELADGERFWPGTESQEATQYAFDLRFGDPKRAFAKAQRDGYIGIPIFLTARIAPTQENIGRFMAFVRARYTGDKTSVAFASQALGEFGREDELYELLERTESESIASTADVLFRPMLRKFRADPRFMHLAARINLVDYWRTSGHWPDFCFEPDLPYDCKDEAAKVAGPAG